MGIEIYRRDIVICLIIVVLFGAWLAYAFHDINKISSDLNRVAQMHVDDWFTVDGQKVDREQYDYLTIVDSEKAFTLFGRAWGVIHFYVKDKGDENFTTFKGIEYFYVHEDGAWTLMDSAGCGAHEHHLRAFDEFLKIGVEVPDRIFDRALGIDTLKEMGHLRANRAAELSLSAS